MPCNDGVRTVPKGHSARQKEGAGSKEHWVIDMPLDEAIAAVKKAAPGAGYRQRSGVRKTSAAQREVSNLDIFAKIAALTGTQRSFVIKFISSSRLDTLIDIMKDEI